MAEETLIDWLEKHVPREANEPWGDFMSRRKGAAAEFKRLHPNAPARPPDPAHEPATTDRVTYRGRRKRRP